MVLPGPKNLALKITPLELILEPATNRLVIQGRTLQGHRRWEAAVLATLIAGDHACAATACGAAQFDVRLAPCGQTRPLTRKQWGQIWQSIRSMYEEAGAADALASRLFHAPRRATVGPWWWSAQGGDSVAIEGAAAVAETPLPQLAADGTATTTAALCRQVLMCQSFISEGQLNAAMEALVDQSAWTGATPELHALRLIRLAEVQALRRDFNGAEKTVVQARHLLEGSQAAAIHLDGYLSLVHQRMVYARDPVGAYEQVLSAMTVQIHHPARLGQPGVDNHVRGLALNLAALCERRWIERHATQAARPLLEDHARRALRYWFAALFGFCASNQNALAHNMCSNVAYMFQRLCELDIVPTPDDALAWYALAQAWHNRFDLPDDTVWEYIFIGDFWLDRQDVRDRLREDDARFGWAGHHPATMEFYSYALGRAQEIGDPRQLAHAALNVWRFGRLSGDAAGSNRGSQQLEAVLDEHPDLRPMLEAEGYVLPKSG